MSYLSAFSLTRVPLLFQKMPCHLVALVKDSAFLTSHSSFGLFYCVYPLLTRDKFVCVIYPLNSSLFGIKIEQQSFILKQVKPFAEFTLLFATSVQYWHTNHKSYITCSAFPLGQSIISIIYHPWLYWKFVLDKHFLRVSDFCEGLAPILLITSLSKDKVPSVEKPYEDFISYGNVTKLFPIEPIKTKRCLLLDT